MIPLSRGRLKAAPFLGASSVLAFLVVFFWLWPTITEISFGKLGSIKTNVEQARVYLSQIKAIEGEVRDVKAQIEADATRAQKLQKAIQPRLITEPQRLQLVAALPQITPKSKITVTWKLFDNEAKQFGRQILAALNKAGFDAEEIRGPFGMSIPGQWIALRDIKKYQNKPSWVGSVQAALKRATGIEFPGEPMDLTYRPEYGEVSIVISAKP